MLSISGAVMHEVLKAVRNCVRKPAEEGSQKVCRGRTVRTCAEEVSQEVCRGGQSGSRQ